MEAILDQARFNAKLCRPAGPQDGVNWAFVVLPKAVSERLPRRGRTSVQGSLNGAPFQLTLEPDGQLSHWLKLPATLLRQAGVEAGDTVTVEVHPCVEEPEPDLPPDFKAALEAASEAKATWDATTTIARIDWVHWIESAKQDKTRLSRIANACDMLAKGKKRVCCFDPSGYYSKSLSAPRSAD